MRLFTRCVLHCGTGLRGAAAALKCVWALFPRSERAPSANGGQMWLLRLGLFELTRSREWASDWIWIIDHTIQIGRYKAFIVVAVRLSVWEAKRHDPQQLGSLTHEDISTWRIELMEGSNGPKVAAEVEQLRIRTGNVPCAILNDCGGDVQNGVQLFCQDHPETTPLNDICHAVANALKHVLDRHDPWNEFLREASRAKNQMRQTKFAFLMPPELKHKARWLNVGPLMKWMVRTTAFLQSPTPVPGVSWEPEELEEKLGWLRAYPKLSQTLGRLRKVIAITVKYGRQHGYHRRAKAELKSKLRPLTKMRDPLVNKMISEILTFVERQAKRIKRGERYLASSEVMESLIGKSKQLARQQSKSGFTKMLLAMAACTAPLTNETLLEALTNVPVSAVNDWTKTNLGLSVQAQRNHYLHTATRGTKVA